MSGRGTFALRVPRLLRSLSAFHITPSNLACRSIPLRTRGIQRRCDIGLRRASTAREIATDSRSLVTRLKNLLYGSSIALFLLFGYYAVTDVRFSLHQRLSVPVLQYIYDDAEEAHHAGTKALKTLHEFGIHPRERGNPDAAGDLQVKVFGHILSNPIGTSAGIDKGAEIPDELLLLGPAYVEVGGITPLPQEGNSKPRLFRVASQSALVNRFGLNSEGCDRMAMRLRKRVREYAYAMGYGIDEAAERKILDGEAGVPPGSLVQGKLMAIQIAKNKSTPEDVEAIERDYVYCVEKLSKYADVIVVNVSSPNTENLRDLQRQEPLTKILRGVVGAAIKTDRKTKPAVLVKVSPDEDSREQVEGICEAILDSGVDGVIVGNTTKRRPDPLPAGTKLSETEAAILLEQGGYSGPQLFERTVSLVKRYRQILDRSLDVRRLAAFQANDIQPTARGEGYDTIEASIGRDTPNLKTSDDASTQRLIHLPERHTSSQTDASHTSDAHALSTSNHNEQSSFADTVVPSPTREPIRKVIFCSGGITNGKQALEVLNAGADLVQIYTALVYGGVGTIARIKSEMRTEMTKRSG